MMIIGSSSIAFGVVLVFLDKDIYEIPTPDNPLTIFIDSPGKVIISVSNGEIATVLGETTSGEFTIYHDDYNFMEGTMLIANHINDYTLKEWTDVSTFSKNGSTESAKESTSVKTGNGGGCLIATATYGSEIAQLKFSNSENYEIINCYKQNLERYSCLDSTNSITPFLQL